MPMWLKAVLKWCVKSVGQIFIAVASAVTLFYLNKESLDSLIQALSKSGIGFLAWWQADTPVANWRLVLATTAFIAVPIAFFFLLNRRVSQLTRERNDARQRAQTSELENTRLSEELASRHAAPSKPVFVPDRFQGMVLRYFWEVDPDTQLSAMDVSNHTELHSNHAAAILDDLLHQGLISDALTMNRGKVFFLNVEGRKFVRRMVEHAEKTSEWPPSEPRPVIDHAKLGAKMAAAATSRSDQAVRKLLDRMTPQDIVRQLPKPGSQEVSDAPAFTQPEFFALRIISEMPEGSSLSLFEIKRRGPFTESATRDALDRLVERGFARAFSALEPTNPAYETFRWHITDKGRQVLKRKR